MSKLSNFEKSVKLYDWGFYIGVRDPKRNKMFPGNYMVAEYVSDLETEDASEGGFCLVGDNLTQMINEAYDWAVMVDDYCGK